MGHEGQRQALSDRYQFAENILMGKRAKDGWTRKRWADAQKKWSNYIGNVCTKPDALAATQSETLSNGYGHLRAFAEGK